MMGWTTRPRLNKYNIGRIQKKEVASTYYHEHDSYAIDLEHSIPALSEMTESVDE